MTSAITGLAAVAAGPGPDLGRMQAVIAELAGDVYAGRRVGTAGGRAAAGWSAGQLQMAGAVVRVEEFPVIGTVRDVYALPALSWRDSDAAVELVFRRDFCEHLASADLSEPRTGRPAVAADADVLGAWVLDSAFSADRITALAAAGAVGVVVPRGTDAGGWMPKMIAGPAPAELPILAVGTDLHQRMRATADRGRLTGSSPVRTVDVIGSNVYGLFRPRLPGLSVLLTAHFDGVGDDPDGTRFPAACDNAAGVAAVIEAARTLNATLPAGVGLAVALLDGEEAGARGSAWHARFVEDGTFVINLDGAAQLAAAAAVEAGGAAQPLLASLDLAGRQVGVPLRAQAMPSNNRRYAAAGLPTVGIGMGMPGYQTPAETADRVDPATLLAASRLVIATVINLADGFNPTRPQS